MDPSKNKSKQKAGHLFSMSAISDEELLNKAKECKKLLSTIKNKKINSFSKILSTATLEDAKHRLLIKAFDNNDLLQKLNKVIENRSHRDVFYGFIKQPIKSVFVYSGMGPQWWGMGRQLYEKSKVFYETINKCNEVFKTITNEWSIKEQFTCNENESRISETNVVQPMNLALQIALTNVCKSYGIRPDATVGHSTGELTAFYEAGIYNLEQAFRIAHNIGIHQKKLAGVGGLLALNMEKRDIDLILEDYETVSIAAINSENLFTLAGTNNELEHINNRFSHANPKFLHVDIPYHGKPLNKIKDTLINAMNDIYPAYAKLPAYSSTRNTLINGNDISPQYWWENVRNPVYFSDTMTQIIHHGYNTFIEIGPHPVLCQAINQISRSNNKILNIFYTMRRYKEELRTLEQNMCELYCVGGNVNLNAHSKNKNISFY